MSASTDRTIYLVLCDFTSGPAWVERNIARTGKRDTIEDIRTGELSNVLQVIELNVGEFSSRDVTEDILQDVKNEIGIRYEGDPPSISEWLADHARDHRKNWQVV